MTGQVWFWNIGLNKTDLPKEPPKFCSWGLDLSYCDTDRFVSVIEQFPKPADPNLASLLTMGGSACPTFRDDLGEDIAWTLQEQNLSMETVQLESAFMFSAAEGGWSWWSGKFPIPTGPTIMAACRANASQSVSGGGGWTVTNAPKIGIFPLKAVAPSGKHQFLLSQAIITQSGFPTPAPLPINWPVFLGVIGPVEIVKLTNGKSWCTVAAQLVNGSGQKLDVTHASVRFRDQNGVTLHKANFTSKMRIDQDVLGAGLDPVVDGPVSNSDAPLPKLYDGFVVPATLGNGTVKILGAVKFNKSGALDCYGDSRTLKVKRAPVTNVTRLPYGVPKINGVNDPSYRWHWGNGIGGTTFNAHSYPEHRYSYDILISDTNNQTFADPVKMDQNDNFYAWGQEVLAISDGDVIFANASFENILRYHHK